MGNVNIRDAHAGDAHVMLRLIKELAAYERVPDAVKATEADLVRDGFGANPRFFCRLAEMDGEIVGFCLWVHNYSTWLGRPGIWLEDLFVTERARGLGIGRRLLADLADIARGQGAQRLELAVLDWNPARNFYEKLGIRELTEWRLYRLKGADIEDLAEQTALAPAAGTIQPGAGSDDRQPAA